jgi:hypothetical protein
VEIEFAANLSVPPGAPAKLGVLQIRPLALSHEAEELETGEIDPARVLCRPRVMGHGRVLARHPRDLGAGVGRPRDRRGRPARVRVWTAAAGRV